MQILIDAAVLLLVTANVAGPLKPREFDYQFHNRLDSGGSGLEEKR